MFNINKNYYSNIVDNIELINNDILNIDYDNYINYNNNNYESEINNILNLFQQVNSQIKNSIKYIRKQTKKYNKNKNLLIEKIDNLLIDTIDTNNTISNKLCIIENKVINNLNILENTNKYKIFNNDFIDDKNNLDLFNIHSLSDIKQPEICNKDNMENIVLPKKQNIDIGLGNHYSISVYPFLSIKIPLNILVYIEEIKSVVIKVGTETKYKYINASIGSIPDNTLEKNNVRSIICNNNVVKYNKKCINGKKCSYYHDPIIGYADIAHYERQYSYNPIIYNCVNFRDGKYLKENIKKISWEEGLNLYQTSLACVLHGLIHSLSV